MNMVQIDAFAIYHTHTDTHWLDLNGAFGIACALHSLLMKLHDFIIGLCRLIYSLDSIRHRHHTHIHALAYIELENEHQLKTG